MMTQLFIFKTFIFVVFANAVHSILCTWYQRVKSFVLNFHLAEINRTCDSKICDVTKQFEEMKLSLSVSLKHANKIR